MATLNQPSFVTTCSEDEEGNLLLEIPDLLLEAMGWHGGTVLDLSIVANQLILREVVAVDDDQAA